MNKTKRPVTEEYQRSPSMLKSSWQTEIELGPAPPPRKTTRSTIKQTIKRCYPVVTPNMARDEGTSTAMNRKSIQTHPRYRPNQRSDEPLWGIDVSYWEHPSFKRNQPQNTLSISQKDFEYGGSNRITDFIGEVFTKLGESASTWGGTQRGVRGSGSFDEQPTVWHSRMTKVPPISDLHPPITSSEPLYDKKWMIQPPPPAKFMFGKMSSRELKQMMLEGKVWYGQWQD